MKIIIKKLITSLFAAAFFIASTTAPALAASDKVLMQKPAEDAAFVMSMEGFQNPTLENLIGKKYTTPEGLVIRQSRIENGKIIIPPAGLYYDVRISSSNAHVLKGNQIMILGKTYYIVDTGVRLDVIKDVEVKKGESVPLGDGSKVLELSSLGTESNGFTAPKATFQILKPSGNYYGAEFNVATNKTLIDIAKGSVNSGTTKEAGSYLPGQNNQNWQREFYDSHIATSGQSYLVVDEVTAQGAKVKEFATGAMNWVLVTEKKPVEMKLAKGEQAQLGEYVVKVNEVTNKSATVELVAKDGTTTQKTLGPVTDELLTYLPTEEISRNKLAVKSAKEDVEVLLDLYREPFKEGKVSLVGYTDLIKLTNPGKWPSDDKFLFRPDT